LKIKLNSAQTHVLENYDNGAYSKYVNDGWIDPTRTDVVSCPALDFMLFELSTTIKNACHLNIDKDDPTEEESLQSELDACFTVMYKIEAAISKLTS
jgi:hypothetical protein